MKENNIIRFNKKFSAKKSSSKRGYAIYKEGLCFYDMDKDDLALKKFLQAEKEGYESADMFSFIARLYIAKDEFEKTKYYAKKSIKLDKEYGFPYCLLGGAYYENGDFENALKYELLAEKYEYNDDVLMMRQISECYTRLDGNHLLKEIEYATKAIDIDPKNAYSYYFKGWIYYINNECKKALKFYLKSEEMGYSAPQLYFEISYCYSALNEHKKAVEYANKRIFMDKSDPMGYYRKGFAYMMAENLEKAKDEFLKAEKRNCKEADMYSRLGFIYQTKNNFEKAIEYADKSIKIDKTDIDGYFLKGNIYAALKKDYKTALKFYKKSYKIGTNFSEDFYANLTAVYILLNKNTLALNTINNGVEKYPTSYNLLAFKIQVLQTKKMYEQADELTEHLLKLYPENPWNEFYIALTYYNNKKTKKDYNKVIDILSRITDPEVIEYGGTDAILSFSYFESKQYPKALAAFIKFFHDSPCVEDFIDRNKKELKKYYKKLLKKYPNNEALEQIGKLYPLES
ncbi:hypothetical protein IJ541_08095 [bacterium]|nr:hypothetical protein [bacterium]